MYGCVAGYADATFRGGRAISRYEAAALLNACLERVSEVTDELRRLATEFEQEMALLKGRTDGLEARVGELAASRFSPTTKLQGFTTVYINGVAGKQRAQSSAVYTVQPESSSRERINTALNAGNMEQGITL